MIAVTPGVVTPYTARKPAGTTLRWNRHVLAVEFDGDQIAAIRVVSNPEKAVSGRGAA